MQLAKFVYPACRRSAMTYVKHGVTIADPYDHLEQPDADETKDFVTAQNSLFSNYISSFENRPLVREELTRMQNFEKFGSVYPRGDHFYYSYNPGLANQGSIMRTSALHDAPSETFIDPNGMSADGTTSLSGLSFSDSSKLVAYQISEKGSDWQSVSVMDVKSVTPLADRVEWVKFSEVSWLKDEGFFYHRYPTPQPGSTESLKNGAVYYHKIGTLQDQDVLVYKYEPADTFIAGITVSDCHKYVVISVFEGCEPNNFVAYAKLPDGFAEKPSKLEAITLFGDFDAEYSFLGNADDIFYFKTTKDAPLRRIIAVRVGEPKTLISVVKETQSPISSCAIARDKLIVVYLNDVKHEVYIRPLSPMEANLTKLNLPIGQVYGLSCRPDSDFVSLAVESFVLPTTIYYFTVDAPNDIKVFRQSRVEGHDPQNFEVKQVFFDSDGTKVPMFVFHSKTTQYDGKNPTVLYVYGGFNVSILPDFRVSRIIQMKNLGMVYAVANIRGGGEYGETWHQSGAKFNKINCFKDVANAAQHLAQMGITNPRQLAIEGGSNGGLVVAASANLRPDLFGAVLCDVGVLDMYKFHQFTIGHAWTSDFGNPEVEEDFRYLTKYSPLHTIKADATYPAVLVLTADHDDRVVPAHSLKFLAELQHVNPSNSGPFLGRIDVNAGHGAGTSLTKRLDKSADVLSFLAVTLGATWRS